MSKAGDILESINIEEFESSRLVYKCKIVDEVRMFVECYVKTPDWIDKALHYDTNPIIEMTVDFLSNNRSYFNHIIAHRRGAGYGTEAIQFIINKLRELGKSSILAYVEADNGRMQHI